MSQQHLTGAQCSNSTPGIQAVEFVQQHPALVAHRLSVHIIKSRVPYCSGLGSIPAHSPLLHVLNPTFSLVFLSNLTVYYQDSIICETTQKHVLVWHARPA